MTNSSELRKRTHTLASSPSCLTGLVGESSLPGSSQLPSPQLPSPLSSIDEDMMMAAEESGDPDAFLAPSVTRRRRSTAKSVRKSRSTSNVKDSSASDRMDIPLAVALVPPLGSFLTGGDFLRDLLLFLLLFFYLHQARHPDTIPAIRHTYRT